MTNGNKESTFLFISVFFVFTGLNNPSITNGCVDQQQQRLGGPTGSVQGPSGNGSLQRPNGGGHNLQLHAINSTVGTHVWELTTKKIDVSIIVTLSEKSCQPWKQTNNCLEPKTFALEVDLRLWRNVLIVPYFYIWKIEFFNFFFVLLKTTGTRWFLVPMLPSASTT